MFEMNVPYDKGQMKIKLEDKNLAGVLEGRQSDYQTSLSENEIVEQSLDNPIGSKSLEELAKGKTLLVIAHRLSTITDADQIVVLKNGRIEAKGTQAQLLENCPLYERMWQAHVGARHWAVGGQKGGEPICSRQ